MAREEKSKQSLSFSREAKWYTNPALLIAAREQYGTFDAISEALGGPHPATLAFHWRRMGLEKLPRGPKPRTANNEELQKLYESVYGRSD